MVVNHTFQEVFDIISHSPVVTLPVIKENALKIEFSEQFDNKISYNGKEPPLPFANSEIYQANISKCRRITAINDSCKAVYEIVFDVAESKFSFTAGDTIGIIPHNLQTEVDEVLNKLDLCSLADLQYTLNSNNKSSKIPLHIPVTATLRHTLTHCVDLRSVLKKLFLLSLSIYTKDENERKILEYLCSKEGSSVYQKNVLDEGLCLLDIFRIFKTCKPPIEVLLVNLPRLLPRPYSIVNSGLKNSNEIKICFSVLDGKKKKGLTSGWLESIILNKEKNIVQCMESLNLTNNKSGDKIPIYLRKNMGGFSLPQNLHVPLLLIGPGTGVAPYLGFLEEIELIKYKYPEKKIGEVHLFFGCRDPKLDFIYEEELYGFLDRCVLRTLNTAFSRVENDGIKYIQDSLRSQGKNIARLLTGGVFVYICGDLKTLTAEIKDALVKCLQENDDTVDDPQKFIDEMQKDKRFFVDAWS